MIEASPIQEPNYLVQCAALTAVFVADDVAPKIKNIAKSILNTIESSGHEGLDYSISGCHEIKKSLFVLIPTAVREIWEFPQGIPLSILNELGSYLEHGFYEPGKYVFSVLDETCKGIKILFEVFFQHVFQEFFSYTSSGFYQCAQAIAISRQAVIEAGIIPCQLLNAVGYESLSYTASGIHETVKAITTTTKAAGEGLFESYQLGCEVAEEIQSYAKSGVSETARAVIIVGGGALSDLAALLRFSPIRTVLEEMVSYCESGAHQIVQSGELVKNNIDEATYSLREGAQSAAIECATYIISGLGESKKGLTSGLQAVDEATLFPRELVCMMSSELFSHAQEGVVQTGQGIQLGITELDEGTKIPREMFRDTLLEIASYTISGINEAANEINIARLFTQESMQYPAEIIVEGIRELVSYSVSGNHEMNKSGQIILSALSEAWQLPKGPVLHTIDESISYLKSGQYELTQAKNFVTVDVADSCYQEIVLPIEQKFAHLVELGRRIRAARKRVQ